MSRHFTIQCSYSSHHANTVTVEADTLEEALEKALEAANEDPDGWRSTDHVSDTVIDAVCEGADCDPWGEGALPVPDRFTERGEPPVVTLTGPVPPGAVEVSGGRVLVRIATEAGTVTSRVVRSAASARQQTARHGVRRTRWQTPGQGRGRQGRNSHSGQLIRSRPGAVRNPSIPNVPPAPSGAGAGLVRLPGGRGAGVSRSSAPAFSATGGPAHDPRHRHVPQTAPAAAAAVEAAPRNPAHKRAIADAVWTDLLWLMPPDRTVTVTVRGGNVSVELGPPDRAPLPASH